MKIGYLKFIAALALSCVSVAASADGYPSRAITWINPSGAGGPTDTLGRTISEPISRIVGQPIVTENVPGAGGTIGSGKAARAAADGYTFLVGHVGYMAAAVSLYKKLPYDPIADFEAVFRMPSMPGVLVVNPEAPYKTLPELIAYAKANPGKVSFADGGVGTMSNLVVSMLASRAGIDVLQVSHKGNAPALVSVLGGHTDAMIEPPNTAMPHVKAGKLRALATTASRRLDYLPDAPAIAETYDGFDGTVWFGLYAPKGTPKEVVDKMHQAYLTAMQDPSLRNRMNDQGMQLVSEAEAAPDAFARHTAAAVEQYREVIRAAKIEPR
jgi:tripartite-type tricarboxylate transporter receptor subunit TctC